MRNLILSSILLLSSIIPINLSFAHVNDIRFRQISPPGGFTLDGIKCIIQDDLGYIWMGTSQGLIKIDSKNTNWFVPSSHDPFSLPSEMISNVFCDSNNQIWVSTNRGLCKFVREQQNFEHISYTYEDGSKSSESVIAVLKTENDKLLIIDAFYFGFLNLRTKQFIRIGLNQIDSPTKLYKDKTNRIWIGTLNGDIFRYHSSNNKVRKLISVKAKVNSIFSENHEILVGTEGEGASLYDIEGTFIKKISFSNKSSYSNNGNVRVIKKDKAGRFWFGTYEGLYMDDGRKIERFKPDDYPGLPHNSIYEIFEDKYGVLWFGTWSGGVALIHQSDNNFKTFRHSLSHNSISNSKATAFVQIDKNELLIGTEVGGLNSYNLNTGEFKLVNITEKQEIETIKSLCIDKQGGIWVGTFRKGLWYRSKGRTQFKQFKKGRDDGQHISSESVYALCATDSGVWIGTFQNGINFYSFKTKTIRHCFLNNKDKFPMNNIAVTCIHRDNSKNLWIGTYSGILYKIHLPTEDITQYAGKTSHNTLNRLENNTIFHIWENHNGDLWCATNNKGILILNPTSSLIRNFDAGGLLKGKNAYGIIEDQNKIIWITSNIGLLSYNPLTQTVRQFVYSDGIQSDVFCPQAIYRDTRDNLYFGGANGFTKINGANLHLNTRKPFTVINKVTSNNKKTIYPIYADRFETNPIILNPEETTFRINFSSDNYLLPEKNKYKYRLINFYDEWIDVQNEGSVLFTNVDAGEYIFEVKSCNNDGIWNELPSRMHLTISNHWYFTKGAYFIYVLLFSFVVYLIARLYYERIRLKQVFLLEKNKRENEEQIHEMKLKFFTNISHEFRTPLTLISWPLKRILNADNITQEQREELEVAKRNSNRLLQLINQIIDFRKLEKGKVKLNISKIDIIDFTKELLKSFSTETKTREINFLFVSPFSTIEIEADREKLDTILYNLLSNAYKYV